MTKIKKFIDDMWYEFIKTEIVNNPHELGDYKSLALIRLNEEAYDVSQDYMNTDDVDEEHQTAYSKYDDELTIINDIED